MPLLPLALPATVTSISAPHLAHTMMLFVPDADLLTKCPQLQQWVISISLFIVILHQRHQKTEFPDAGRHVLDSIVVLARIPGIRMNIA